MAWIRDWLVARAESVDPGAGGDGSAITISCWRNGTTHAGRYRTTGAWDRLADGAWVSGAFVYIGAATIGPSCGSPGRTAKPTRPGFQTCYGSTTAKALRMSTCRFVD